MNPFHQPPTAFVNSGPESFMDFNQYESEYYAQYLDQQPPQPPPKTPTRTPVMGTRTYQHRRTHSNASSQYSNRGSGQVDYGEMVTQDLDYRFNNFNITGAIEPSQFHSVPYNCNQTDTTNAHPNRMRMYENVSHFQHLRETSPLIQHQTPLKTSYIDTTQTQEIKNSSSITNSMRREMFFNPEPNPQSPKVSTANGSENHVTNNESNTNNFNATKVIGSTPTHSTPQDSFSDDSSYLSALSSQNRDYKLRFSPDNILTDSNAFSPTSRAAVANLQRALVRRTLELEEGEKS
jgi:hypothetical protein